MEAEFVPKIGPADHGGEEGLGVCVIVDINAELKVAGARCETRRGNVTDEDRVGGWVAHEGA